MMVELRGDVYGHDTIQLSFDGQCDCGAELRSYNHADDGADVVGEAVDEVVCEKCGRIYAYKYNLIVDVDVKKIKQVKAKGCAYECKNPFRRNCDKCKDWEEISKDWGSDEPHG